VIQDIVTPARVTKRSKRREVCRIVRVCDGGVDAAFDLVPAAPTASARVFSGLDHACARRAADRGISLRYQWMRGQVMLFEIGVDPRLVPIRKRIDLQPTLFNLEARECGSR